jgi:hypothetical protein
MQRFICKEAVMRFVAMLVSLALASSAAASPPPPPPEFVMNSADVLAADVDAASIDRWSALFADDVVASLNGTLLVRGKADWVALARANIGKVNRRLDGYTMSSSPSEGSTGELLVIDEIDAIPPPRAHTLFDPRWSTRATQYEFGSDHLIHTVRILEAKGFFQRTSRR